MRNKKPLGCVWVFFLFFFPLIQLPGDFTVPYVDLLVKSIEVSPMVSRPGGHVNLTIWFENTGNVHARSNTCALYLHYSRSNGGYGVKFLSRIPIPAIEAGGTKVFLKNIILPDTLPMGPCRIHTWVDAEGVIVESNEANNDYSEKIIIQKGGKGKSDLLIGGMGVKPSSLESGKPVNLTLLIENQGRIKAPRNICRVTLHYQKANGQFDIKLLAVINLGILLPGQKKIFYKSLRLPDSLPSGTCTIKAQVDADRVITEQSEDNNENLVKVTIQGVKI